MKNNKIEIKWGFLFVIMTLVWMTIEKLVGLHDVHIDKHPIYTNFIAIPAILIYVLALLEKRNKFYHGLMSYKQGFISGLILTLVVTIFAPFTQLITSLVITPDYFTNVINYSVAHQLMTQQEAENYFNLKSYVIQTFLFTPVMGIFTTAIVALFVKRKEAKLE